MTFREAQIQDIPQLMTVRFSVKENVLSNPALVTEGDYEAHLTQFGKGWVCESDGQIVGFSIVNLEKRSIWALFIRPEFAGKGIGKQLQRLMLDWTFAQTQETICLGTSPNTVAEKFYRSFGWKQDGFYSNGEIKFEMSAEDWRQQNERNQ